MKKKVIAIVMMATLLFAGCQESNQTDIPILSDVPKATATVNPTEMPVITEVPIVTNIPVVTEKPEVMENPIATEIPAVTDIPEVTEEPVITEEPNISELPVLTEKPTAEPTESPEAAPTEMPTVTMTVEPTTIPEPTADPIVTVVPTAVPTNTPVPTMTPVPTATVKPVASPTMAPTNTPKPTATPRPTATPTPKPTPTTKPVKADASKYLLKDVVREDTDWDAITGEYDYNEKGDKVEYWNYDRFTKDMEGIISSFYSQYKIYELKERPSFAGEPKTVKVKDSELNNKDFMKKGIYVGDSVIIDSYTYEQDGNTSNGKEPIVWKVAYMQILCSANEAGFYFPAFKYFPTGSQLTIQYYLVSEKVLDNLRMDEWDDVRLYSGKSSGEYLYEMDTDFTLDFMKYGSSNVGNGKYRPWIYNTTDFKMAYNQLSLEKGDNISPKITPTKYAMNNGLAVDGSGICERVWLDAERSAPDKDGYILDYAWLSLRKDGKLEFLKQYEEAGFLPELTIWTGVDTTPPREGETLVSESEFGVGNWLWDEDIINKDIWNPYASFVTWDWVIN